MGCAGNACARTPNLDQLASGGTRFSNGYCPSPLCGPSRAAFMTGLLPIRTGVEMNADVLPSHLPTFAHALTISGYGSVLCGRMHFVGPDQRHGFQERLVGDYGPTDVAQRMHDLGIFHNTTGQDADRLACSSGPGLSDVLLYDEEVTAAACGRIQDHEGNEPLFMTVGLYGPHNPYVCPRELFNHYNRILPRVPEAAVREFRETAHPAVRDWINSRNLPGLDPEVRHAARAGYYGMVETVDRLVGRIINCARSSFGDNLIIAYLSDHGDMAGEKGLFWKSTFYEGSVGIPWIWNGPGIKRGQVVTEPVTLLDLAPTLAELGGSAQWPPGDGISLAGVLSGGESPPDRPIIATLTDRQRGNSAMVRSGRYKLVEHFGHERPQLFDLASDPDELHDHGRETRYASVLKSLRKHLEGNWDPDNARRHAAGAPRRMELFRAWAQKNGSAPVEHWQGDTAKLWFDRPSPLQGNRITPDTSRPE